MSMFMSMCHVPCAMSLARVRTGQPSLRRWIYNSRRCGKCNGPVKSWQIQARTCYACEACQPLNRNAKAIGVSTPTSATEPEVFMSHCAPESLAVRLATPQKLRVAELRAALEKAQLPTSGTKATLVERLQSHLAAATADGASAGATAGDGTGATSLMRSARAAARDKAAANESRAVEHIAELEDLDDGAPEWLPIAGDAPPTNAASRKRKCAAEPPEKPMEKPGATEGARRRSGKARAT